MGYTVVPTVITQKFLTGATVAGVTPVGTTAFKLDYESLSGGPFQQGEVLSWDTGAGSIIHNADDGDVIGEMIILLTTGTAPTDGDTITGADSLATADVSGTPKDASDSGDLFQRGRYKEFSGLSSGGLIDIPEGVAHDGYKILNLLISLPGISVAELLIIDTAGDEQHAGFVTLTSGKGYQEFRNGGLLVAPGCQLALKCTGTLSAAGRFMMNLGKGWPESAFDGLFGLGKSGETPPGE